MLHATSPFTLDVFLETPTSHESGGVRYGGAHIDKTFRGDIVGTSSVEMLSVSTDAGGAGYVALERFTAAVHGRQGSFALLHIGTMNDGAYWAKWPIVPDSGTEELDGIIGEARIEIAADGAHTLYLDYEIPETS